MKKIATIILLLAFSITSYAQVWEQMTGLPGAELDARHHPVTFSIDGLGYIVTGSGSVTPRLDNMYSYDPNSDSWTKLADFPGGARSFAYGVSYGQYAFLGFGTGVRDYNDLWRYDSKTDSWEEMATCPCNERLHPAFVRLEDKIYVGLGNGSGKNFKDWWEYDIINNSWAQKADFPGFARHHPYHFEIGQYVYAGFGHGSDGRPNKYKDFYRYDPATDTWERISDLPAQGRVAGTQFSYNGEGYALSGQGEDHGNLEEGEFWKYKPDSDTWEQLASHPGSGRWAPGNFIIDNYVYFMAGLSDIQLESDLWRFKLAELTSEEATESIKDELSLSYYEDYIKINGWTADINNIIVVNISGETVMTIENSDTIDITTLSNGYYILIVPHEEIPNIPFFVINQ